MAKTFEVLGVDGTRGVMLVKFSDGPRSHITEVPFPPNINVPDVDDADLEDWIIPFWPHSHMEAPTVSASLANKVGLKKTITLKVPNPSEARGRRL